MNITVYGREGEEVYRRTVIGGEDYNVDKFLAQIVDHWDRHESVSREDIKLEDGYREFNPEETGSRSVKVKAYEDDNVEIYLRSQPNSHAKNYLDSIWDDEIEAVMERAQEAGCVEDKVLERRTFSLI